MSRNPGPPVRPAADLLRTLDYAVIQQCMHCGMCLPTCPTYDATRLERNSPRGRISLMRAIADGKLEPTRAFADEMSFCLGCLACETACPAGVDYATLFESARSTIEKSGIRASPLRTLIRAILLKGVFLHPRLLRFIGRSLELHQRLGFQSLFRRLHLTRLLPVGLRNLERQTPTVRRHFSNALIAPVERPPDPPRHRVAVLTGCFQDLILSEVNRDTVDVLLANACEVHTPPIQHCCGSLLAHNGEMESARWLARRNLAAIDPFQFDAIITNAGGCGSHLKNYEHLLHDDPRFAAAAAEWSRKVRDIHEWLTEISFRHPAPGPAAVPTPTRLTYHESCHLCHGQKITRQPRAILDALPGFERIELPESTWCCGSAGVYNITQPAMSAQLLDRKMAHLASTRATVVATANPGCHLQLQFGAAQSGCSIDVKHPISLLAAAYRAETPAA